jgi:hypothetical protein
MRNANRADATNNPEFGMFYRFTAGLNGGRSPRISTAGFKNGASVAERSRLLFATRLYRKTDVRLKAARPRAIRPQLSRYGSSSFRQSPEGNLQGKPFGSYLRRRHSARPATRPANIVIAGSGIRSTIWMPLIGARGVPPKFGVATNWKLDPVILEKSR